MVVPWLTTRPYFLYDEAALAGGLLAVAGINFWSRLTDRTPHGNRLFLLGLAGAAASGGVVVLLLRHAWPGLAFEIGRLSPWRPAGYVAEAIPLLKSSLMWPVPLWNEFGACSVLATAGAVTFVRRGRAWTPSAVLLIVWTVVIVAATFGQIRFTYYLAINVALLAGFACDEALRLVESHRLAARWGAAIAVLLVVSVPIGRLIDQEWGAFPTVPNDWYDALQWLRSNSPEPFGAEDVYYKTDAMKRSFEDPTRAAAYGVLAWWDHGYWITRIAHRIPNSNPKQTQVTDVAAFLLSQTSRDAAAAPPDRTR